METIAKHRIEEVVETLRKLEESARERARKARPDSPEWLIAVGKADAYNLARAEMSAELRRKPLSL